MAGFSCSTSFVIDSVEAKRLMEALYTPLSDGYFVIEVPKQETGDDLPERIKKKRVSHRRKAIKWKRKQRKKIRL